MDLLEDRRFDEVVLLTDHRGAAGSVRRFADRLLARRLGRRFAVASLVLPA